MSQGDLGLRDKSYYTTENNITIAYKNYIRDLAQALNNGTSINDTDVTAIFEFEKAIATVIVTYFICTTYILFYAVSLDTK
jgi:hypothetical protein